MAKITVLLVEDHIIVRKGLLSLLVEEPDIEVVGEAGDGWEAVSAVQTLRPDVVVMDITMPRLNGLEATSKIKHDWPQTQVVILTMHTNEEYLLQILQAGAAGYVVKQAAPDELVMAIRAAQRGDQFLSPLISGTVIHEYVERAGADEPADAYQTLTGREREVLQLLAEGYATREVADLLVVSVKTAESHRSNLMRKLDIHNLADLTRYAIRKGIVTLE